MIHGLLLVDKPPGWTSFDIVAKVRGIIKAELKKTDQKIKNVKVGHTGTLDPAATGLLVLCIGKATKRVPDLIKHDKTYEVEITLGATSTTDDGEGVITTCSEFRVPSAEQVRDVMMGFVGPQMQMPPQYSALKINGKKAYELARAGKSAELKPRPVTIHDITNIWYEWPIITYTTSVSSGTYIRSLARDIGDKLCTGAYMSALRRTVVDNFNVNDALRADELSWESIASTIIDIS